MKTIELSDMAFDELSSAIARAGPVVQPPIVPPIIPPVQPPIVPPVQAPKVTNDQLVTYVFGGLLPEAHEYQQVYDFWQKHQELATPAAIVEEYRKAKAPSTHASDVDPMMNEGTGFPIEQIRYPEDAFYIFRRGQMIGHPLWDKVLAGRQSQINVLINLATERDIVAAQNFDASTYAGQLLGRF